MNTDQWQQFLHSDDNTCHLWGIINLTPDSFSDGGTSCDATGKVDCARVLEQASQLITNGATVLDIGAESTRPGAADIGEIEEMNRLLPALTAIRQAFPNIIISIDTRRSTTANEALTLGADIINDISGLDYDPDMAAVVGNHNAGIVLMHSQGTPQTMQANPTYSNVVEDILQAIKAKTKTAIQVGVAKEHILWDVGFGFGKTTEHNLTLLNNLDVFAAQGFSILAGLSRKSFLARLANPANPPHADKRDHLSTMAMGLTYHQGIRHFRVHNVAQHHECLQLLEKSAHH